MAYKVVLDNKAELDFAKLDKAIQQRIFKYLQKIQERDDPRSLGEPLQENLSAYWKYRVGDYRLIVHINDEVLVVLMIVIAHRRDVYKTVKKRV